MRANKRTIAETHIGETLRGSLFDPAYGAQSWRTPGQVRFGEALDAVIQTRPTIATLEALDELLEAINARGKELRDGVETPTPPGCALLTFGLPCTLSAGHRGPCHPRDTRPGRNP